MPDLERQAQLGRWLAASRDRFPNEEQLTRAARAEIQATDDELTMLLTAAREGHAIPIIDEATGEILAEEDVPFEVNETAGDGAPVAGGAGGELVAVDGQLVSLFGRVATVQM